MKTKNLFILSKVSERDKPLENVLGLRAKFSTSSILIIKFEKIIYKSHNFTKISSRDLF